MNRKRQRKRLPAVSASPPSTVVLTFAAARMLKDALGLVDEAIRRNTKPLPHLELAVEVLDGVKTKLDAMLQQEEWHHTTPFDYNELHILYAALHMYRVGLTMSGNQQLMSMCLQLCKQFRVVIETNHAAERTRGSRGMTE